MPQSVIRSLETIYPLPEPLKEELYTCFGYKTLAPQQVLLQKGQTCQCLYFVKKGLLRAYHYEGNKEVTSWFMEQKDVVMSVFSFYTQQPSYENIEALENTELLYLHYNDLQRIYASFPEANALGRMITERYFVQYTLRTRILCMPRARDRYLAILERRPELIQRVPLSYLASYLDMTIWTLSKVRAMR